jgi:hypothetical protein
MDIELERILGAINVIPCMANRTCVRIYIIVLIKGNCY